MKKQWILSFVAGTSLLTCLFTGCSSTPSSSIPEVESTVTLTEYAEPIDIHSDIQKNYLKSGNPSVLASEVNGRTEFSLPKSINLSWTDSVECSNYTVLISESENFANAKRIFTNEKFVDVYNLKIATKYYWKVSQSMKDGTTSKVGTFETVSYGPRNLYVDGVTNVRDVGGWETATGRTIQGKLYRGGRLNNSYPAGWVKGGDDTGYSYEKEITAAGAKVFNDDLKIKTEIDFRTRDRNGYPGTTDDNEELFSSVDGVNYVSIPMNGDADINSNKAAIKQFFNVIANEDNYPVFYHCNIGTDRTGMVTYLINALCGVAQNDLYFDYMFSNFGLIALPSAQVANPSRKELSDLTTGEGSAARVSAYSGTTLQEKARACLLDCGISETVINAVYNIMTGN